MFFGIKPHCSEQEREVFLWMPLGRGEAFDTLLQTESRFTNQLSRHVALPPFIGITNRCAFLFSFFS